MGYEHGRLLAGDIRRLRRIFFRYLAQATLGLGALPLYLLLVALAYRFRPFIPTSLWQEMRAVAAGSSLGLPFILLTNVFDDLVNNFPRCSAFAARDTSRPAAPYVVGRNLDYPLFTAALAQFHTFFVLRPENGHPLVSLAWPGYVGVCTGLTASGVVLAQLVAMTKDRTRQGLPAALLYRQALQMGDSLAEVTDHIISSPRTLGNNLLLASDQEACVLELSARHWALRPSQDGLLTVTNHYQTPLMRSLKGRFPPRPPFASMASCHFTEAYSLSRNQRLQELAGVTLITPASAPLLLGDPGVANPGTLASSVFDPANRKIFLATSGHPPVSTGPFTHLPDLWAC